MGTRVLAAVFLLLLCAIDLAAQYGGPSLLSRGGNRAGRRGRAPINFSAYFGLRGMTEKGLLATRLEDGTLVPQQRYSGAAEAGIYGGHEWRRSALGVDYRGDYRYSTQWKQFNGFNQALSIDYQQQVDRRWSFGLQQTGGISNRAFGAFAAPAFVNQGRLGIPLNEVYDVRTYFAQSAGSVAYRKSARTTFAAQAQGFFIKRSDTDLINGQGYGFGGQWLRRMTRKTEVGAQYQYVRFEFPKVYSSSNNHSVAAILRRQFTRNWDLETTLGVVRSTALGTRSVALSPEVAFILGRTTGLEAFRQVLYRPQVQVTTGYTLERSRFSGAYFNGVGNGNGVYLTSSRQTVNAGYSYTGIRRASLGASAGYSRISNIGFSLGVLHTSQAGVGLSYRLAEHLDFSSQADYRTFSSPGVSGREGYSISVGLTYTTSRLPLSIW